MTRSLTRTDEISTGDFFVTWKGADGDFRALPVTDALAYMQANLTTGRPVFTMQYAAPNASGFNVTVTNSAASTHLILTPLTGYAVGAITLPAVANAVDQQEVLVNCTQAVTAFTVNGNGATVVGAPTASVPLLWFRLKFDAVTSTWYRVG